MNRPTTVLTYGTFDLFHIGHLRLLQRARALGDFLVVGVSTDEFSTAKGKTTYIEFSHRIEIVRSLRCVDAVLPETCWEQKRHDIECCGAGIFVMGSDWAGRFDFLKDQCQVIYLPRTSGVSSTNLRTRLASLRAIQEQDTQKSLELPAGSTCRQAVSLRVRNPEPSRTEASHPDRIAGHS